jgi:hypothetical protein
MGWKKCTDKVCMIVVIYEHSGGKLLETELIGDAQRHKATTPHRLSVFCVFSFDATMRDFFVFSFNATMQDLRFKLKYGPPGRGYRPSAVGKGGAVAGADSRKAWPSVCVSIVISPLFDRALISVPCLLFLNGQHVSLASSSPPSIQYFSPKPHHAVPVLVGHLICVPGIKTSDIGVWMDQTLIIELRVLVKRVQVCQYGS